MKVLMISGDPNALKFGSETWQRMEEYGALFDELHILVLIGRNFQFPISNFQTNSKIQISKNTFAYSCLGRFLRFWRGFTVGKKVILDSKFQILDSVITAQDMEYAFLAWILSKIYKIPWQMQIHTDIFSSYFYQHSVLNKLRVWLAKFLLKRADCIRVVSERIKKSLLRDANIRMHANDANGKITILPIFVDTEKIKNTPIQADLHQKYGRDKFIILMASRITREKNIGLAIGAAAQVFQDLAQSRKRDEQSNPVAAGYASLKKFDAVAPLLLIVGDGPEKEKLESKVGNLELGDSIKFEPHTNDLISYYKTCDLFLLTSNYEGYGRTLVEAAAAGAKIVSSDVGIASEILEPECIFKVGDKEDLKQKLVLALENKLPAPHLLALPTKKKYLRLYKNNFEICLNIHKM